MWSRGGVCLTLFNLLLAWYWWSIDTNKGILKVASLFECHLNIDSVSLESEGANQSLVPAKHSLTNTQQVWLANPSLASSVVLECMQVLAKFETKVWQNYSLTTKSNKKILHANGQLHDITSFQVYNALAIKVIGLIWSLDNEFSDLPMFRQKYLKLS